MCYPPAVHVVSQYYGMHGLPQTVFLPYPGYLVSAASLMCVVVTMLIDVFPYMGTRLPDGCIEESESRG